MEHYSIDDIERLTGISKFTLRNWEKRYSFLKVMRKANGHRTYHRDDLELLISIKKKIDSGISLSKAIRNPELTPKNPYHFRKFQNHLPSFQQTPRKIAFSRLLNIIQQADSNISRICLAKKMALSNELTILESHDELHINSDLMSDYYRCFVRMNGSLFQMKKNQVRTYSQINNILDLFGDTPIQKSIHHLARLGHRSGLTLPLFYKNMLVGLLFLNSTQPGHFEHWHKEKKELITQLLNLLPSFFPEFEDEMFYWGEMRKKHSHHNLQGQVFTSSDFLRLLNRLVETDLKKLYVFNDYQLKRPGLYVPLPLASLMAKFMNPYSGTLKHGIKINISQYLEEAIKIEMQVLDEESPFGWDYLTSDKNFMSNLHFELNYGTRIRANGPTLEIYYPAEFKFEENLLYSIC